MTTISPTPLATSITHIGPNSLALSQLASDDVAPLAITPVLHPRDGVPHPGSRTFWSATANALYIVRQRGSDIFGLTPDLADKLRQGSDLVDHGRRGPIGCDADAIAGLALWQAADEAAQADRPSEPVAHHIIGWLPTNGTREAWRDLTLTFLDREVLANGMVADWAIHALADGEGCWIKRPHFHAILTHRFWKPGRRTGEPNVAWLGTPKHRQRMMNGWINIHGL